jgi:glycine dehydrogenase subunit 2
MQLIFERSKKGRKLSIFPKCDVPAFELDAPKRASAPRLPEISENELDRHYTELAKHAQGMNDGFYPLGSCTMKYNPKINERVASMENFTQVHPLQAEADAQGSMEVIYDATKLLCEITGMDDMTLQPAAGAHGEFTGLLLIKAYHVSRGDTKRTKIIVPDSAHGTNPASAAMANFEIINVESGPDGCVDLDKLRAVVGEDTAGLMLTNPNTVGIFDKNILEITSIIHKAGGLCYYDGANLNAVMGQVRPGDMGFDVIHLNLHKTFSTPHGGGGPGSGPCGCKAFLAPFLPGKRVALKDGVYSFEKPEKSIGDVRAFYGNFLVYVKALSYILMVGKEGIPAASKNAVLNANYMKAKLQDIYPMAYDVTCMHEFVMCLEDMKHDLDVSALDVAKALLDRGIHPPTMYFPLIVHEALMVEPTETECKETLDHAINAFRSIYEDAKANPERMHMMPMETPVKRLDETRAARTPIVKYAFEN